ncbi:unnamed protein product, partial [Clonostachys rosea]
MTLNDVPLRPKRPAMPGTYSRGLNIGKPGPSSGTNCHIQGPLPVGTETSGSGSPIIGPPEQPEKVQDQHLMKNRVESLNNFQARFATYPDTFHAPSSSTSSDFHKSESGASYSTELSTAPSTSPSPSSTSQRLPLPEVKDDECLSLETHVGNQLTTRDDPYRNPIQIPGCLPPTFVYPHSSSSIRESYHNRFREVVNLFRRNTYEDPKLRESMRFIDYTLKLCGTSPADARPSILAFCRKSDFKALNRLLTNKELKYQYCLRRSSWRPSWLGQETAASATSDKPLFNLYFWRQGRPRSLFWGQYQAKVHESRSESYPEKAGRPLICGSIVEIRNKDIQFSTLGCTLQIGSEWYTTTARHAFRHAFRPPASVGLLDTDPEPTASITKLSIEPGKECDQTHGSDTDPSDVDAEDYLVDDIEYESLPDDDEEDDWDEQETQIALDSYWDKINATHRKSQDETVDEAPVIFITSEDLDKSGDLDLDWALLKWEKRNDYMWVPNTYNSPSLPSSIFLSKIAQSQPEKETPVLVLTSRQSPRYGVLQAGIAMLGGISGRQSSVAWSVSLNEKRSLTYGDSGALVVDALTNDIYGHVIGSNPLGEIYISPFVSVLHQIRQRFPGQVPSLPEPSKTETNTSATTDDIIELYNSLPKGKGLATSSDSSEPRWTSTPNSKNVRFQHDSIEEVAEEDFEESQFETRVGGDPYLRVTRVHPYPDEPRVAANFGVARNAHSTESHFETDFGANGLQAFQVGDQRAPLGPIRPPENMTPISEVSGSSQPARPTASSKSRPSSASSNTSVYRPTSGSPLPPRDAYYQQTRNSRVTSLDATNRHSDVLSFGAVPIATVTNPRAMRHINSPHPQFEQPSNTQRLYQRHSSSGQFLSPGRHDRSEPPYRSRYENRTENQSERDNSIDRPAPAHYHGPGRDVSTLREPQGEPTHSGYVSEGQDSHTEKLDDGAILDILGGVRPRDDSSRTEPVDLRVVHAFPDDEGNVAPAARYSAHVGNSIPLTVDALWRARAARASGANRRSTTSYATSQSSASIRTSRTSQSYDTDITAPSEYGGSEAGAIRSQRSSVNDEMAILSSRRSQRAPGVRQTLGDSLRRLRAQYNRSPPDGMFSSYDNPAPRRRPPTASDSAGDRGGPWNQHRDPNDA